MSNAADTESNWPAFELMQTISDNSPRASSRFNHVVEAKRFEGVFLCIKKYAEFKNQSLIKIRWYTNWLNAKDYPRGDLITNSPKMGVPYTTASN